MHEIRELPQETVDQIAAGEVVERPFNVVKELVENAIDAGASAISVELKEGGIQLIRVTDNGSGIPEAQVRNAFKRHATSKIKTIGDLFLTETLGFRGEALASIASVAKVDMITKEKEALTGTRCCVNASEEVDFSQIGAPDGTTVVVRDLFFNTPVRRKFLKSAKTEGSYCVELMEHLALSHPGIAFHVVTNQTERFHTSGNGDVKEIVYRIYGKDTALHVMPVSVHKDEMYGLQGYLGEPVLNRSNRNYEILFVNGRFVREPLLSRALEDGYRGFVMQHKFPFAVLYLTMPTELIDVNVHPSKMEVRFHDPKEVTDFVRTSVHEMLAASEMIPGTLQGVPDVTGNPKITPMPVRGEEGTAAAEHAPAENAVTEGAAQAHTPEPFETNRIATEKARDAKVVITGEAPEAIPVKDAFPISPKADDAPQYTGRIVGGSSSTKDDNHVIKAGQLIKADAVKQLSFFDDNDAMQRVLSKESRKRMRLVGQVFDTYYLFELDDTLYLVDQHAAHEKVNYERMVARYHKKERLTQSVEPPLVIRLSAAQQQMYETYASYLHDIGFLAEPFGAKEIAIREVPLDLYGETSAKDLFLAILDEMTSEKPMTDPEVILNKIASMACKASVKGNTPMHGNEMEALLDELLLLDEPYHCPHGRPTIVAVRKYELDKRFQRIVK